MDKRDSTLQSEITRARGELAKLLKEKAARDAEKRKARRGGPPWWAWLVLLVAAGVIAWLLWSFV